MTPRAPFALAVMLALVTHATAQDGYLEAARETCLQGGGFFDCVQYKAANLLHRIASTQRSMDLGMLRLVSLSRGNTSAGTDSDSTFLSRAAQFSPQEPQLVRMFKFGLRQLELFLNTHGLSLPLGAAGPQLVYDDGTGTNTIAHERVSEEGRSRNLHLIVPLMIMVKLMSIKALLIPTLLGVAAIKKFIILTVMLLPSVLHKLKACKIVPHLVHYTPHHTHSHEFHDDYHPHHEPYHPHQEPYSHDHHGKDWDVHRRMGKYRSLRR